MLTAQTPAPAPSVLSILKSHAAALASMHLHAPKTHETIGTLSAFGVNGAFHEWQDGQNQRRDERLGIRTQRELRLGDTMWVQNTSGEIRELHGLVARRQITEDFIDSGALLDHAEYVHFIERATLPDGRSVYRLRVAPPKGEPYTIAIDTKTSMIDQESYVDHDAPETITYDDFRVVKGLLVPFIEIDSNGDAKYDITSRVTSVSVDQPIAHDVFEPFRPATVDAAAPVTVPMIMRNGLPCVDVEIGGHVYPFLIDSGSQGDVIDVTVAQALGLHPKGALEIRGAARTQSLGVVETPTMSVGGAALPAHVATVLNLANVMPASSDAIGGVLGYPFFAAAEVRFDPDHNTVTIAKPGTLLNAGNAINVDTDRELAEIVARIDGDTDARVVVDTGNSRELLLFKNFIDAHRGMISLIGGGRFDGRGIGGTTQAVGAVVDELDLAGYRLFNRYTDVILATAGAFADRNDGGNVGFGVLRNFVATFDLANAKLYLARAQKFDDGRFRSRVENAGIRGFPPRR